MSIKGMIDTSSTTDTTGQITLEARTYLLGEFPFCAVCEQAEDSDSCVMSLLLGKTATFIAGTRDWVCRSCAHKIDPALADFAYFPENPRKHHLKLLGKTLGGFGVCPECGDPGGMVNVHKDHWIVCYRHGYRWHIGYGLFSNWQFQTRKTWQRNGDLLMRCVEVEPVAPNHSNRHGNIPPMKLPDSYPHDLVRAGQAKALTDGQRWGDWVFNQSNLTLAFTLYGGEQQVVIDLKSIRDSASMLDSILRVHAMAGAIATASELADLLDAFVDIFNPQTNLCSGGRHKTFDPTERLKLMLTTEA